MLHGLLSIKSSTEIGTLHRKGRDPPQNTKCQETFVTQDEETHAAAAVQNVPDRKMTRRQRGWAGLMIHTFHQRRDHTNPVEPLLQVLPEGWPEAKLITSQHSLPFPESLATWKALPLRGRLREITELCGREEQQKSDLHICKFILTRSDKEVWATVTQRSRTGEVKQLSGL